MSSSWIGNPACIVKAALFPLLGMIFLFPTLVYSQSRFPVTVFIESSENLQQAYALVVSDETPSLPKLDRRDVAIDLVGKERWRLTVSLKEEDYQPGKKVLLVAKDAVGAVHTGSTRWVIPPKAQAPDAVRCENKALGEQLEKLNNLSEENLDKLIEIRLKRKKLYDGLLARLQRKEILSKLNDLEKSRGLSYPQPLSAQTPKSEFLRRLALLDSAAPGV